MILMEHERTFTRTADSRGRVRTKSDYAGQEITFSIEETIDVDQLPVMRAVHFITPPQEACARLFAGADYPQAEAAFGIDHDTGPVIHKQLFREESGKNGVADYNRMTESQTNGALVAAYYGRKKKNFDKEDRYHLNDYIVIGICPPGSEIRAIPYRSHGANSNSDKLTFIKTLPLVNTVRASRKEYPKLFENFPRGFSITNPRNDKMEELIRKAYSEL